MAFVVQQHKDPVANANSYATVEAMRSFFLDRGVDLTSRTDAVLQAKLVEATDFMDARYQFIGRPERAEQGTACPRYLPEGARGGFLRDLHTLEPAYLLTIAQWKALEKACIQLAYRALTSTLLPDPVRDASGQRVLKKTVKAGAVESSKEFADDKGKPDLLVPSYPAVDLLIKSNGLLAPRATGTISRA